MTFSWRTRLKTVRWRMRCATRWSVVGSVSGWCRATSCPEKAGPKSIIDAINGARVFVLVFSGNANSSPQIEREVERAVSKGVPIVPVRIEDVRAVWGAGIFYQQLALDRLLLAS